MKKVQVFCKLELFFELNSIIYKRLICRQILNENQKETEKWQSLTISQPT